MRARRRSPAVALAFGLVLVAACRERNARPAAVPADGPQAARVEPAPVWPRFRFGRRATASEIAAWDHDVDTLGRGLPAGSGTAARGVGLYAEKCAACHGASGEGGMGGLAPKLIGREPREGFPFGREATLAKTIGNYWPYATTVYDYIDRAMPLNAPGSLTPEQVYSLTAYLLERNEIIPRGTVLSRAALPRVRMPAHGRFVPDDRRGGPEIR